MKMKYMEILSKSDVCMKNISLFISTEHFIVIYTSSEKLQFFLL